VEICVLGLGNIMNFRFCPVCASPLEERERFGAVRPCCTNAECGFVYFLDPKVVAVVLVEHDGKLLLGKRNIDPAFGKWNFPGGYVNRGEKVELAALREVKEETNLDVELTGLLNVYSEENNPAIIVVYTGRLLSAPAEMRPQEDEVTELAFFAPDDLPELAFGFEPLFISDWQKRELGARS
jgi:8-oxo-dGTP diphosphatase